MMVIPFKRFAKALLPVSWQVNIRELLYTYRRLNDLDANLQRLAASVLPQRTDERNGSAVKDTAINRFEMRFHSQNGEDGIVFYLFQKIGVTNRKFVEIGIGDGMECNTANLAINLGWEGVMLEADRRGVLMAQHYYESKRRRNVNVVRCLVTAENINDVLREHVSDEEIDLLCIDIDGNDYWVWKAVTVVDPRVVIIEYNSFLGSAPAITVEYDPHFRWQKTDLNGSYYGASLAALTKLGNAKGYVLVGCDSTGTNAFFVRKDAAEGRLSGLSVEEAYFQPPAWLRKGVQMVEEPVGRWVQV